MLLEEELGEVGEVSAGVRSVRAEGGLRAVGVGGIERGAVGRDKGCPGPGMGSHGGVNRHERMR